MNNVLEFYLRMKDMMSGGLVKMAQTAKQSFNAVTGYANNVVSANKKVLASFNQVIAKIKATDQALIQSAQRQKNNRDDGLMGGLFKKAAAVAAVTGVLAFAKSSVASAMDFTTKQKTFEVLASSPQAGRNLAQQLFQLKQNTIMGTSVYGNAQTMLGFGIKDNEVIKDLKQIGDIAIGDKDRMQALTLAFSQTMAAGKLMGQDLLQYINAGFNPLQVMQEHWKEFGFKAAVTGGQLREMVEKGQISAAAVSKAFEIATAAGGRFHGMMDAIAQTSAGKLKMLEGHFAAFKIEVGNALMPLADSLMSLAEKTLTWLNLTKTAPQALQAEHAEIISLLGVITSLNQGNDMRSRLLNQLSAKYPDIFKNIDTEKIKNSELLGLLNDINTAYKERISLATSGLIIDTNKKQLEENQAEFTRLSTIVELLKRGDKESLETAATLRTFGEGVRDQLDRSSASTLRYYTTQMSLAQYRLSQNQKIIGTESQRKAGNEFLYTLNDAYMLAHDKSKLNNTFGKDSKRMNEFLQLANQITLKGNVFNTNGNGMAFAQKLRDLMNPGNADATKTGATQAGGSGLITGGNTSTGIASGGPRQIIINGVNMKVADHVTINNGGDYNMMERTVQDMFLRVLNSGASVQ